MITTDSREAVDFQDAKGVELGVAPMPYHDDVYGGRQHTLADGPRCGSVPVARRPNTSRRRSSSPAC